MAAKKNLNDRLERRKTLLQTVRAEVHDNIGPLVSVVKMNLQILENTYGANESDINESVSILKKVLIILRKLCNDIDTELSPEGNLSHLMKKEIEMNRL